MNPVIVGTSTPNIQFEIAQSYFAHILNAQLVIFSVIVGAIVALYFVFNYKVSKNQIESSVDELRKQLMEELSRSIDEKTKTVTDSMTTDLVRHETMLSYLRGQTHRALGQFWDSQNSYAVAFIWWVRAASDFAGASEQTLARIALDSAKKSVEKVEFSYELESSWVGEYQNLLNEISDVTYRIEKELLDKEFKNALERKIKPALPTVNI